MSDVEQALAQLDAFSECAGALRGVVEELNARADAAKAGFDLATEMLVVAESRVAALLPLLGALAEAADQAEADAKKLRFSPHGRALQAKARDWQKIIKAAGQALSTTSPTPLRAPPAKKGS